MDNISSLDIASYGHSSVGFSQAGSQKPMSLNMILQLQTTLDLNEMLRIFAKEAAKFVKFENIALLFDDQSIRLQNNDDSKFENNFTVSINSQKIANLVYSTKYPLNSNLENTLEHLHQQLKFSLRNAIEYARIKSMALRDHLTGLGNRGYFDDMFQHQCSIATRGNAELTLLLLDLDNFKQVNDHHGHDEGDQILRCIGEIISKSIRESDFAFRFGGDEFAIILTNTSSDTAQFVARRISCNVSQNPQLSKHGVTSSMGLATWSSNDNPKQLFSRADQALYQAKNSGRNCFKSA